MNNLQIKLMRRLIYCNKFCKLWKFHVRTTKLHNNLNTPSPPWGGTQFEMAGGRPIEAHIFNLSWLDPVQCLIRKSENEPDRINIRAYAEFFFAQIVCLGKYSRRYKFNDKKLADLV